MTFRRHLGLIGITIFVGFGFHLLGLPFNNFLESSFTEKTPLSFFSVFAIIPYIAFYASDMILALGFMRVDI